MSTITSAELLTQQQVIESKLNQYGDILSSAPKGQFGLTLESAKTPEWREAKRLHAYWFDQLRKVNTQINKIRKFSHFECVDGKRRSVYKYSA